MKVKSIVIRAQLPISVIGTCITTQDVLGMSIDTYGVLIREHVRYGGRCILVPWSNITSIEVEPKDEVIPVYCVEPKAPRKRRIKDETTQ